MFKNKEIAKLHFITKSHPTISHAEQAIRAYHSGCKWVQLRMKDVALELIEQEVLKIIPVANAHNAILLINDHVEIVKSTGAHGVHLGKMDICPTEARRILGNDYIIGGTANTYEDVVSLINKKVDYVGLGPYKFTDTKKNLSPVLGKEGYEQILKLLKTNSFSIPLIAIGGISYQDVELLKQIGIYGIAMAGAILNNNNIETNIQQYQQLIY